MDSVLSFCYVSFYSESEEMRENGKDNEVSLYISCLSLFYLFHISIIPNLQFNFFSVDDIIRYMNGRESFMHSFNMLIFCDGL